MLLNSLSCMTYTHAWTQNLLRLIYSLLSLLSSRFEHPSIQEYSLCHFTRLNYFSFIPFHLFITLQCVTLLCQTACTLLPSGTAEQYWVLSVAQLFQWWKPSHLEIWGVLVTGSWFKWQLSRQWFSQPFLDLRRIFIF